MLLSPDACYEALLSHDARFDGMFFVGVRSTRVYCRPICRVKQPKKENCLFFARPELAEAAGFRPCLRCRPELAPGPANLNGASELVGAAWKLMASGEMDGQTLDAYAAALGVSSRHLRRRFLQELGVTPLAVTRTRRLLLAKQLVTDSALPLGEVALASGFGSLRRFNDEFRLAYRMPPSSLRKRRKMSKVPLPNSDSETGGKLVCRLGYRAPFDWQALLGFLASRSISGVEQIDGSSYCRTVEVQGRQGWIRVTNNAQHSVLEVEHSASLFPVTQALLERVRQLFDLNAEPARIAAVLGDLAAPDQGLRVPGAFDRFEMAIRAIIGQQVSVKGASTLAGRLAVVFGEPIETPWPQLKRLSPRASELAAASVETLQKIGLTRARATTIQSLAAAVASGRIDLGGVVSNEARRELLLTVPGIGPWTVDYLEIRAFRQPDAFPAGDLAVRKALEVTTSNAAVTAAERWRPWRAYAVMHLWKSLEQGVL
ncbi:MAG: helix-turn-helix domain-containing protein [Verrucomicrobia bacterium]|nr:helix-turn-helix domain-containing protein [Verrucomicrobiota bacterium]